MAQQILLPELEVGVGTKQTRLPGRINCDLYPGPNVDVVFDLMKPWPFKDNSVRAIHANHVLEHLPDPTNFFKEAWRVTAEPVLPASTMHLRLPYGPSEAGIGDITHVKMFGPTSFACFWPRWIEFSHNPQHQDWVTPWGLQMVAMRINPDLRLLMKPLIRKLTLKVLPFLWGGYVEMAVHMTVIKSEERLKWWFSLPESKVVPVSRVMWEDEYRGWSQPRLPRRYIAF